MHCGTLIIRPCVVQFQNCFWDTKSAIGLPTSCLTTLKPVLLRFLYPLSKPMPRAPSGAVITCPVVAISSDDCRQSADWIRSNINVPSRVQTTAAAAPLLMSYITADLCITLCRRRISYSSLTNGKLRVSVTYGCFRGSSHFRTDFEVPNLFCSIVMDDATDTSMHPKPRIHPKPTRRQSPSCNCQCPFVCYVIIDLPAKDSRVATFTKADLSTFYCVVEFPNSAGFHNDTHDPSQAIFECVGGVRTFVMPSTAGKAFDDFLLHFTPRCCALFGYLAICCNLHRLLNSLSPSWVACMTLFDAILT